MNQFFPAELSECTVHFLRKYTRRIQSVLDCYNDEARLSQLISSDRGDIIAAAEMIGITTRACSECCEYASGSFYYAEGSVTSIENLPVTFSFDGECARLKTPLTLKRGEKGREGGKAQNYLIVDYVSAALCLWKAENQSKYLELREHFHRDDLSFIITRRAKKYNCHVHCDNDNIENGRVQNTICSFLGISDSARVLDLYSCFKECENDEEIGTEFILTTREKIMKYI